MKEYIKPEIEEGMPLETVNLASGGNGICPHGKNITAKIESQCYSVIHCSYWFNHQCISKKKVETPKT